jgi:HAD superfamily hydrolase (TIGR01549 family)
MTRSSALAEVIGRSRHLLFDFDGPICSIFAGLTAPTIAAHLRETLASRGVEIPADVQAATDPFDVLRFAPTISATLAEHVEAELRAMETRATETVQATPNAREVIEAGHNAGRRIAAVSNNSRQAVTRYLTTSGLARFFDVIVGRSDAYPDLLKPHPHLITQAIKELGAEPSNCVLIGDSLSDIEGARNAGSSASATPTSPARPYASPKQEQTRSSPAWANSPSR